MSDLVLGEVPISPVARDSGTAPSGGVTYDGRFGELFRLWIKVILLEIVTLGFYRFWGRTRIRKYLWSRIALDGERFEYDGTGRELFIRFLVTLVVLAPLLFGPSLIKLAGVSATVARNVQIAQAIIFVLLANLGYYTGRRYRLSRTLWRGIRGALRGRSTVYALLAVATLVASLLTLGLYSPWQTVRLWRYEANHTAFGTRFFFFAGKGRQLFPALLACYGLFLLTLGLVIVALGVLASYVFHDVIAAMVAGKWDVVTTEMMTSPFTVVAMLLIFYVGALLAAAVAFPLYEARRLSYMANHTRFGEVVIAANLRWGQVLRLLFGNVLIQIVSFGLAKPFVAQRTLRFYCRHLRVTGLDSLRELTQSADRSRPPAEGLAQLLDSGGLA